MGSKTKETTDLTVQDSRTVMGPLKIRPAAIIDEALEVSAIEGLPAEFLGGKFAQGFPPTVKFENPGDFAGGVYVNHRDGVGPNKSRIYELNVPNDTTEGLQVVVWGSTALDRLFDSAYPPVQQGDKLAIIYVGEKSTNRKQNPVKLFALKVIRA